MKERIEGFEMTRVCRVAFGIVFCLLAIGSSLYAQVFTGSISGTVTDGNGAIIPAANLTLVEAKTGLHLKTASDTSGLFMFPNVDPGEYVLTVQKEGFEVLERTGITLQTGERLALGAIALSVGSVTQTVSVSANTATVDTESAEHEGYITSEQVETQLMFGRNIASLATLLPGIEGGDAGESINRQGGAFSSQGSRTDSNRFSVDGINSTDIDNGVDIKMQQSADAIAEVTVLQNNYDAEYANAAGAMVVEITKSGTKDFHGGVNYYTKNEFFNANSYFDKLDGLSRPRDRVYNINYSIGGPVTLKSFNRNRDKLFFFWDQEFWPNNGTASYSITVPTDLERQGDFSQSPATVIDPTTGQPFPENKIPSNRIDANGQAILNIFPHANFNSASVGGQYNYVGQGAYSLPDETRTLRIDYNKSSNDRFSFTWTGFHEDSEGFSGTASYFGGSQWPFLNVKFTAENNGLAARWTHTISAATVNEAAFSWQTNPENAAAKNSAQPLQKTYGLNLPALSPNGNPLGYVPGLVFGGVLNAAEVNGGELYVWLPYHAPNNVFDWTEKLSSLHGTHFIKVGAEVRRFWRAIPAGSYRFGNYTFTSSALNPLDTGYDYANAILGIYQSYEESNGIPRQDALGGNYDVFAQDTWKVGHRLSLDYGIRLQYLVPLGQKDNKLAAFYPSAYDPTQAVALFRPGLDSSGKRVAVNPITGQTAPVATIGAIVPNYGTPFNGMVSPSLGTAPASTATDNRGVQIVPRFGFSWDIFGDHKTALRGGAGVFLSPPPIDNFRDLVSQPPLLQTPQVYYSTISDLQGASQYTVPGSVLGNYYNDKTPVSYNFNLGIQRNIGFGTIVDVGYVGALDRHLLQEQNRNSIPFGTDFLASSQDSTNGNVLPQLLLRPIPGYADIDMLEFMGTSNYESLQATANRTSGKWLTYGIAYTWSKAMDFGSGDESVLSTLVPIRQWNYADADFDQTHALKANWLWTLPQSPWENVAAKEILSDWRLSGSAFFLGGTPVTPTYVSAVDFSGSPTDPARLDMTGNPNLSRGSKTFSHAFNTAAFSLPAVGTYGTMRRNPLRGPGSQTWNLALLKNVHFTERLNLELRWETYNIANHANFSAINTTETSGAFGSYTATLDPRKMQLGARLSF